VLLEPAHMIEPMPDACTTPADRRQSSLHSTPPHTRDALPKRHQRALRCPVYAPHRLRQRAWVCCPRRSSQPKHMGLRDLLVRHHAHIIANSGGGDYQLLRVFWYYRSSPHAKHRGPGDLLVHHHSHIIANSGERDNQPLRVF
jgi:hypothetical protein